MSADTKNITSNHRLTGFLFHIHPRTVPESTLRFTLSWGLGGISLTLIFLLTLTGVIQLISYDPDVEKAYNSILYMYSDGSLSGFLRNIHYWSGNLLIFFVFLHFLRVFYTGAFGDGRALNWIIGLCLFVIVCFTNFTGYLLPWDQLAFWAVTIFTSMLGYIPWIGPRLMELIKGGDAITQLTLSNFFVFHIAILPAFLFALLTYHFWLIRKAGGLIIKEKAEKLKRVKTAPYLIAKEAALASTVIALVCLFAVFADAPLSEPANPYLSPNPAKGAWYFLGVQELLLHFHPIFAITIIPVCITGFLFILPMSKHFHLPAGLWFGGNKGFRFAAICFFTVSLITLTLVVMDNVFLKMSSQQDNGGIYTRGIIPLLVIVVFTASTGVFLKRIGKRSSAEITMLLFTSIIASLLTLTAIGIWFRGAGMQLIFPWS